MLIRTHRRWISHNNFFAFYSCANTVRYYTVSRKIAAANHISGSDSRDRNTGIFQETSSIALRDQFRACLGSRIGIISAQSFVFSISPLPFTIFIYFIGCNIDDRTDRWCPAGSFHDICRTHYIGCKCFDRVLIAGADNGLCRHMNDDFRLIRFKNSHQRLFIPDIAFNMSNPLLDSTQGEQTRFRLRTAGEPDHLRSGSCQHQIHPCPLKPRMPGYQNASPVIQPHVKVCLAHQSSHTFHGARPLSQRVSSLSFSLFVSIHCQKPS